MKIQFNLKKNTKFLLITEVFKNIMILGLLAKLRKATIGLVMSVCPHETTGLPLVENFIKFDI